MDKTLIGIICWYFGDKVGWCWKIFSIQTYKLLFHIQTVAVTTQPWPKLQHHSCCTHQKSSDISAATLLLFWKPIECSEASWEARPLNSENICRAGMNMQLYNCTTAVPTSAKVWIQICHMETHTTTIHHSIFQHAMRWSRYWGKSCLVTIYKTLVFVIVCFGYLVFMGPPVAYLRDSLCSWGCPSIWMDVHPPIHQTLFINAISLECLKRFGWNLVPWMP